METTRVRGGSISTESSSHRYYIAVFEQREIGIGETHGIDGVLPLPPTPEFRESYQGHQLTTQLLLVGPQFTLHPTKH